MKKIIICILVIAMLQGNVYSFYEDEDNMEIYEEVIETVVQGKIILDSKNAILYDRTYGQVLFEKNMNERVANASTTKMLTAMIAYENGNLDSLVTVSKEATNIGGSGINLRMNDEIRLDDLIKGLLVHSGNDAAVVIAEHIGGSVENFCKMMNNKAKEMGLENTNFTTPHGLDEKNHYSSAYDLAKMADYLLNIEYLASIVKEQSATIKINDNARIIQTTNEMLSFYEGADGVKTGYTGDAGRCLVTSATRNGRQLISVVLGCGNKKQRTQDSVKLLNYGFNNYEIVDICKNMQKEFKIKVRKSKANEYKIVLDGKALMPIKIGDKGKISYNYDIKNDLQAPLQVKEKIGKIHIFLENKLIKTIIINIPTAVNKKNVWDYFKVFSIPKVESYEIRL